MAVLLPTTSAAAPRTAAARLYCVSLRFNRGTEPYGLYSLDLTTLASGNNGELAPAFQGGYSHFSYLTLNDESWFIEVPGSLALNVPSGADADGDGFLDFFQVARAVNAISSGQYSFSGYGSGAVQASWSRAAGSRFGTCVLDFRMNPYQSLAVFTHTFELLEYAGSLTYEPASNQVTGAVALAQSDNPTGRLEGPWAAVRVATNRFNALWLLPGHWTNELDQTWSFPTNRLDRDTRWPTNYYGYLEFDDGDPSTSEADYWLWVLSVDDPNDADHDGIPDLSDDPAVSPPRRPRLELVRHAAGLWLVVRGDTGRVHQVQTTANLAAPDWQTVLTLTLTNDPQVVSLALPAGSPRFWRALAQ